MTSLLSFPDGHIITGVEWQQLQEWIVPQYSRKAIEEYRNSTTTPTNDVDLYVYLKANAVYHWTTLLKVQGDAAADFKWDWELPTGATLSFYEDAQTTAAAATSGNFTWAAISSGANTAGLVTATLLSYRFFGSITTSSAAGRFGLKWSQATSNVTNNIIEDGSAMYAWRVS